ncbi:DUF1127 domain-containing protein [Aliiroseovarius sp.]|uniref:DUF1127 domain-containing protein n=1 Tax=Aliiroseovarius sp. TaxID=1872442 RepID=UPI00263A20D7|nr:DUF1127 domain-containing protein [Aliiroseovarius sp.]
MTATTSTNMIPRKFSLSPFAWLTCALETRRERRALARLEAEALRDIGLTKSQARAETGRPIWDVPCHWQN